MIWTWAPYRRNKELALDTMSSPRAQNKDLDRAQSCYSRNPFPPDQIDTRKPRLRSKPEDTQSRLTMREKVGSIHKASGR